jgi:hypothetical protein
VLDDWVGVVSVGVVVGDGVGDDEFGRLTVQPVTNKEAITSERTIIAAIGFNRIR